MLLLLLLMMLMMMMMTTAAFLVRTGVSSAGHGIKGGSALSSNTRWPLSVDCSNTCRQELSSRTRNGLAGSRRLGGFEQHLKQRLESRTYPPSKVAANVGIAWVLSLNL